MATFLLMIRHEHHVRRPLSCLLGVHGPATLNSTSFVVHLLHARITSCQLSHLSSHDQPRMAIVKHPGTCLRWRICDMILLQHAAPDMRSTNPRKPTQVLVHSATPQQKAAAPPLMMPHNSLPVTCAANHACLRRAALHASEHPSKAASPCPDSGGRPWPQNTAARGGSSA